MVPLAAMVACSQPLDESDEETFRMMREQMVKQQIVARGIGPEVAKAMRAVPRHEFVPENQRPHAYEDRPLPIGHKQTISQPYIVALMTEQLKLKRGDKVLEIGTGSGYQAAVLAAMGVEVYSIEIVEPLAKTAREALDRNDFKKVQTRIGDGYRGWPEAAPFDRIMVTASPERVPEPLVAQLREGGRMIIPVGDGLRQELVLLEKKDGEMQKESILPVRFVPMTGEVTKPEKE